MQIEMYESELRKVADPPDVDELLKGYRHTAAASGEWIED